MLDKKTIGKVKRGLLISAPLVVGIVIAVYVWGGSVLKNKNPKNSTIKIVKLENKSEKNTSNSYGEKIIFENSSKKVKSNQGNKQESSNKQIVKKNNWLLNVKVSTKNKGENPNDKQVNIGLDFNF